MDESISVSEFKATCLAVLERVRRTGQRLVITRHGEPIAEVGPVAVEPVGPGWLGGLRHEGRIVGDIVSPTGVDWEVLGG